MQSWGMPYFVYKNKVVPTLSGRVFSLSGSKDPREEERPPHTLTEIAAHPAKQKFNCLEIRSKTKKEICHKKSAWSVIHHLGYIKYVRCIEVAQFVLNVHPNSLTSLFGSSSKGYQKWYRFTINGGKHRSAVRTIPCFGLKSDIFNDLHTLWRQGFLCQLFKYCIGYRMVEKILLCLNQIVSGVNGKVVETWFFAFIISAGVHMLVLLHCIHPAIIRPSIHAILAFMGSSPQLSDCRPADSSNGFSGTLIRSPSVPAVVKD